MVWWKARAPVSCAVLRGAAMCRASCQAYCEWSHNLTSSSKISYFFLSLCSPKHRESSLQLSPHVSSIFSGQWKLVKAISSSSPFLLLCFGAEADAEHDLMQSVLLGMWRESSHASHGLHRAVRTLIHDGGEPLPLSSITGSEGEHWCIPYKSRASPS